MCTVTNLWYARKIFLVEVMAPYARNVKTDKAEVDFVIDTERTVTPVEAKYTHLRKTRVPASLRCFNSEYQPEKAYIVNLSLRDTAPTDNTIVHFLPFHQLLGPTIAL